jgi:hypothetical protein
VIQTGIAGANNSIQRYYDFIPANNNNLKATLRIIYFDAELNGLAESDLYQWKTKNNTTWELVGADSRDAIANYVERNNLSKLDRTTLAIATAPVITCPQNYTVSANLSGCKASVNLTGNSGAITTGFPAPVITYSVNGSPIASTYTFSKGTTTVTALASNGVTPTASCTFTVTVVCGPVTMAAAQAPVSEQVNPVGKLSVTALPNPTEHYFTLRASSSSALALSVRVFDVLGRLVEQRSNLAVNLTVSLGHQYRPGVYIVEVVQGKERVIVRLIKR